MKGNFYSTFTKEYFYLSYFCLSSIAQSGLLQKILKKGGLLCLCCIQELDF